LTDVRGFFKRYPAARALHAQARALAHRAAALRPRIWRGILIGGLFAVYLLVVTPIALAWRGLGKSLAGSRQRSERGWQSIRQASSDKRIYLDDF